MRDLAPLALALLLSSAAHASSERVTPEAWAEAQADAARLSGGALDLADAQAVEIRHGPIEDLCVIARRCPRAAVYDWAGGAVYFRDDRPWESDRGHHGGIVRHEAAHSMQPPDMPLGCKELQAHAIQIAWLREQSVDGKTIAAVARNAEQYRCESELP